MAALYRQFSSYDTITSTSYRLSYAPLHKIAIKGECNLKRYCALK